MAFLIAKRALDKFAAAALLDEPRRTLRAEATPLAGITTISNAQNSAHR
jgi:hypothetical protein